MGRSSYDLKKKKHQSQSRISAGLALGSISHCFGVGPFRGKFRANVIGITMYLSLSDGSTMNDSTIIAEQEDSAFWNILRQKVLGPVHAVLGPSPALASPQSMQKHDTDSILGDCLRKARKKQKALTRPGHFRPRGLSPTRSQTFY